MTTRMTFEPWRDDEFDALKQALAIEPSADLAARVRERARLEPMRPPFAWWRWPSLAGAAALAAIVVAAIFWQGRTAREPVVVPSSSSAAAQPSVPDSVRPRAGTPPAGAQAAGIPEVRQAGHRAHDVRAGVEGASAAGARMEVLVSADERIALDRFLAAVRGGRASAPAPGRAAAEGIDPLPEPLPIEIPLLKPIPPLNAVPADLPGSKDK